MPDFVVEFRKTEYAFTYRKMTLVTASDKRDAIRAVAAQLAAQKRLAYTFHSCKQLEKQNA
jgi:hypothetical protein